MQLGAEVAQLPQVHRGKPRNHAIAGAGEVEFDPTAVTRRARPSQQAPLHEPVDEAHCAVMTEVQASGEFADRCMGAAGKALERQERLMLLRREPGAARGLLAEVEKAPQFVPE